MTLKQQVKAEETLSWKTFYMKKEMKEMQVQIHLMNKLKILTHKKLNVFRDYKTLGNEKNSIWCDDCNRLTIEQARKRHNEALGEVVGRCNVHPKCLEGYNSTTKIKGWAIPRCFSSDIGCEVCGNLVL